MENPPAPSTLGSDENNAFQNISSTRYANASYNYTRASTEIVIPNSSSQTNAFLNKPIGPAKSVRLLTGEQAKIEVFAKYTQVTGNTAREIAFKKFSDNKMIMKYLDQGQ